MTLVLALAAPAAAQVPPPPPPPPPAVPAPAPPVAVAPLLPPMPALAPMPPMPIDFDHHLIEMGHALAAMPPIEIVQARAVEAEMRAAVHAPFSGAWSASLDAARFEASVAHGLFADQVTVTSAQRTRERETSYYDSGRAALDRRNWQDAINRFEQAAQLKGTRTDAAMYWKAYAQGKLGQRTEALATIDALVKGFPQSRYLSDAKALELELRARTGPVSPEAQQNEDLKLLAIQGLQHSDPEQVIPLLEKILASTNAPRVKERALYVLALSNSPRAQEILLGIAKGGGNPDLQRKAIDYLATQSRTNGRSRLEEVYRTNSDHDVRMRVLRAYMSAGDRARLLAVAQSEQNEDLRMTAIRYLGASGSITELGQLYDKEASKAIRVQIVRSLASAGAIDRLQQIARAESDAEIRLQAIRSFASVGRERTGTVLQDMYAKETTPEAKRAIIQALHSQNNPEGLVAVARRENDPKLKEDIVRRLSTMTKSKVALDYLMELLNK
ncbi:MAG TPA: HEAT repeat domain-containing protein [Vicinamibacterales bacterium]|nr:HEAT repeat domain-containing protein [Vicinamibacterales bacterium]